MNPKEHADSDEIRAQLDAILGSSVFLRAGRMSGLLRYVTGESLAGRAGSLKEVVIGHAVFDRGPDYDPKADPCVRVEMRRLRAKLDEYYREHPHDPIRIDIPKGSYVPVFDGRVSASAGMRRRTPLIPVAIASIVLIVVLVVAGRTFATGAVPASLAVLPVVDLTPDGGDAPFCRGLSIELVQHLSAAGIPKVPSITDSVLASGEPLRAAGQRLGVNHVLEGSSQRIDGRRRIALRLLDVASGHHIWTHTFDRKQESSLSLEREIARATLNHLRPWLRSRAAVFTPSMEARDLYWKARSHQYNDEFRKSTDALRRALALEPGYALARAALGEVLSAEQVMTSAEPDFAAAVDEASRAAEIDPSLAEAHVALGVIRSRMLDWAGAEAEFRTAIRIDPNYGPAHGEYAQNILLPMRRWEEAIRESERCVELERSFAAVLRHGNILIHAGRHDEGVQVLQRAKTLDPTSKWPSRHIARSLLVRGRPAEAIAELGDDYPLLMAAAQSAVGDAEQARTWSELALRTGGPVTRAIVLARTGRLEQALALLESPEMRRSLIFSHIAADPLLAPLRANPRFREVLRRAGLPG